MRAPNRFVLCLSILDSSYGNTWWTLEMMQISGFFIIRFTCMYFWYMFLFTPFTPLLSQSSPCLGLEIQAVLHHDWHGSSSRRLRAKMSWSSHIARYNVSEISMYIYIYILLYVCNAACMRACFFHVLILSYTSRYIKTYTLVFWFSTNYVWDFCVRMAPDESQVEVSGQTEDIFGYVTYASGFWPRTLHVCWITTLELPLQVTIPRFMTQKKWAQWLAKNILATPQKGIKCNFEMTLHRKASWFNETTTLPTYIHQSVSIGPMHHNRTKNISSPLLSTHYMLSMNTLGKTAETSKTPLQLLAPQHVL